MEYDDDFLRIVLPIKHTTINPSQLREKASAEDIQKHADKFTKGADTVKHIAEQFTSRCVRMTYDLPDHVILTGQIPDFTITQDITFDKYLLGIALLVRMNEGIPTVSVELLPEEFLGHLITIDAGEENVRLVRGPLDAFDAEHPVILHKHRIYLGSDTTRHYRCLKYECAVDDLDARQQTLITKIIRNTLAPLTLITDNILELSTRLEDFTRRNVTHALMTMMRPSTEKQIPFFQIPTNIWEEGTKRDKPVTKTMVHEMLRQCGADMPINPNMIFTPRHSETFHRVTRAIYDITTSFESRNVELGATASNRLSLVARFAHQSKAGCADEHFVIITLSVKDQSTVQLTMHPAEMLGHLLVSNDTRSTVTLKQGPLDSFSTDQALVFNVTKENTILGENIYQFEAWTHECDIRTFDPDMQTLVTKVIKNALAPFTQHMTSTDAGAMFNADPKHTRIVKRILHTLQSQTKVNGPHTCAKSA